MGRYARYESEDEHECVVGFAPRSCWNGDHLATKLGPCVKSTVADARGALEVVKFLGKFKGTVRHHQGAPNLSVVSVKGKFCKDHSTCDLCDQANAVQRLGLAYDPGFITWTEQIPWTIAKEQAKKVTEGLKLQGTIIAAGLVSSQELETILTKIGEAKYSWPKEILLGVCGDCAKKKIVPVTSKYEKTPSAFPPLPTGPMDLESECALAAYEEQTMRKHGYSMISRRKCYTTTTTPIKTAGTCRIIDFKDTGYTHGIESETVIGKRTDIELIIGPQCFKHQKCLDCGLKAQGLLLTTVRDRLSTGSQTILEAGKKFRPKTTFKLLCPACVDEAEARAEVTEELVLTKAAGTLAGQRRAEEMRRESAGAKQRQDAARTQIEGQSKKANVARNVRTASTTVNTVLEIWNTFSN